MLLQFREKLFKNECHRRRTGVNRITYMQLKRELSDQYGAAAFDKVKPKVQEELENAQSHLRPTHSQPISTEKERQILETLRALA